MPRQPIVQPASPDRPKNPNPGEKSGLAGNSLTSSPIDAAIIVAFLLIFLIGKDTLRAILYVKHLNGDGVYD